MMMAGHFWETDTPFPAGPGWWVVGGGRLLRKRELAARKPNRHDFPEAPLREASIWAHRYLPRHLRASLCNPLFRNLLTVVGAPL